MQKKAKEKPVAGRICAVESCDAAGEYKAPKSRYHTGDYQYFCLDHVREFNRAWDYFDGWSRKEIEDFMDGAAHGHRPTWNMAARIGGGKSFFTSDNLRNSFFEMLGEKPSETNYKQHRNIPRKEIEAYATLDLEPDTDYQKIKAQYKKLVKKHHPDVNKGDKKSEEIFKRITSAYAILMKTYGTQDEK